MGELMHTPGPWACNQSDMDNAMIRHIPVLSDHGQVAIASGRANRNWTNANAKLIAAAPELLAALIRLRNDADNSCADSSINISIDIADLAIEKATNG